MGMHKQVWMAFGLLALVGCGGSGGTSGGANPVPGTPGGSDSTRDSATALAEDMMLSQLDDDNNWVKKCPAGSTMWANVCYPSVHVEMDGIATCVDSYGEVCEGVHNPSVKIWLGEKLNANVLFAIGSEVSPLLKKMRWKIIHRKLGVASWELIGTSVTLMPTLISSLITTDDGSNELKSQKVLSVAAATMAFPGDSIFRLVDSSKFSCPVNGTLKINGVEGLLSSSDEDFERIWPKEFIVSRDYGSDFFKIGFGSPRVSGCDRVAESGVEYIRYDLYSKFSGIW